MLHCIGGSRRLDVAVLSSGYTRTGFHPVVVRCCGGRGCSCCLHPFVQTCRLIDFHDCIVVGDST